MAVTGEQKRKPRALGVEEERGVVGEVRRSSGTPFIAAGKALDGHNQARAVR